MRVSPFWASFLGSTRGQTVYLPVFDHFASAKHRAQNSVDVLPMLIEALRSPSAAWVTSIVIYCLDVQYYRAVNGSPLGDWPIETCCIKCQLF